MWKLRQAVFPAAKLSRKPPSTLLTTSLGLPIFMDHAVTTSTMTETSEVALISLMLEGTCSLVFMNMLWVSWRMGLPAMDYKWSLSDSQLRCVPSCWCQRNSGSLCKICDMKRGTNCSYSFSKILPKIMVLIIWLIMREHWMGLTLPRKRQSG